MELSACIRAFEYVAEQADVLRVQRVIIVTDSLYVYENYNRAWDGGETGGKVCREGPSKILIFGSVS